MPVEMVGSMIVFVLLACFDELRRPFAIFMALGMLLFFVAPFLSAFIFGSAIIRDRLNNQPRTTVLRPQFGLLVILGFYMFSCYAMVGRVPKYEYVTVVACTVFFYVVVNSRSISNFLATNRLSQILATLSFPIYLVHYAVINAFEARLIVHFQAGMTPLTATLIGLASVAVSLLAAWCFLPVEVLSHKVSRTISTLLINAQQPSHSIGRMVTNWTSSPVPASQSAVASSDAA
jgi:peptidoglycan/LPS O-acetylase OafA/YrhL